MYTHSAVINLCNQVFKKSKFFKRMTMVYKIKTATFAMPET